MYTHFFGFREKPFKLVPDPRYLYLSGAHKAALTHLKYGLEDRNGFVVITGEVGCGKTLLLRVLMNELPRTTQIARVINTNFNARELLEHVLNELGVETQGETKPKMVALLNQKLIESYADHKDALLVVDEAQNLSIDAIEELRMISNLETNTEKLIQIVMVGQPQLRLKMNHPDLEQLKQRVTVQYHLASLDESDTAGYVNHRLHVAGAESGEVFTPEALKLIYDYSRGVPRLINVVADAALRLGYVEEKKLLDASTLQEVIEELQEIGGDDEAAESLDEQGAGLDQDVFELNKKYQGLYDNMQKAYNQKDEENRVLYERLQNIEKEMKAQENLAGIQQRERLAFEKEQEISRNLSEVSRSLEEVNSLKEDLEQKKSEIQEKVVELDSHLLTLREQEARARTEGERLETSEDALQGKLTELGRVQGRIRRRELALQDRMGELNGVISDLEQKKRFLDAMAEDKSVEDRLRGLENHQKAVRQKEEELLGKIAELEKEMKSGGRDGGQDHPNSRTVMSWKQGELLLELIPRVDSLKSEIDSLEAEKEFLDVLEGWQDNFPTQTAQIAKNFGSLEERERSLLKMIDSVKHGFQALQNDGREGEDSGTEGRVGKEALFRHRLDELRALILQLDGKGAFLAMSGGEAGLGRDALSRGVNDPSDRLLEGAPAGRRFNMLVREVLMESDGPEPE